MNIKKMMIADGKEDSRKRIKSIDDILGVSQMSNFKASTEEEFENTLNKDMNLADMQALAAKVGLLPLHDRNRLKKRLMNEFRKERKKLVPGEMDGDRDYSSGTTAKKSSINHILKQGS